jgi:hypothetical protein
MGEKMSEGYPDDNPKTVMGMAKTAMHLVPVRAVAGMARAFENGAKKYGPFNWREKRISVTTYYAACLRHLFDYYDRIDKDDLAPDSLVHHLDHAQACIAMLQDTMGTDLLNDNRPPRVNRDVQRSPRSDEPAAQTEAVPAESPRDSQPFCQKSLSDVRKRPSGY